MKEELLRIIRCLRKDTEHLIKTNPVECKILRREPIMEDGEVIDYKDLLIANETVRIVSISDSSVAIHDKSGNIVETFDYSLSTTWETKIKKDDIIIDSQNRTFRVGNLKMATYNGFDLNHCYKIQARLKLIGEVK